MTQTQTKAAEPLVVTIASMHGRNATEKVCLDADNPKIADLRPGEIVQLPKDLSPELRKLFEEHPCLTQTSKEPNRPYEFASVHDVIERDPRYKHNAEGSLALRDQAIAKLKKTPQAKAEAEAKMRAELKNELRAELMAELKADLLAELKADAKKGGK